MAHDIHTKFVIFVSKEHRNCCGWADCVMDSIREISGSGGWRR